MYLEVHADCLPKSKTSDLNVISGIYPICIQGAIKTNTATKNLMNSCH